MKTHFHSAFIHILTLTLIAASPLALAQSALKPAVAEYSVAERGPHHAVRQRIEEFTDANGKTATRLHSYTELATGMNYQKDGQWVPSKAEIKILPNGAGAAASEGQHKVIFPADLYDGQVELNTPDGKWLRSRVLGLSYLDTATGRSVLIAEIKHTVGEVHGSNVVIYPDAFTDISADIRYTYRVSGGSSLFSVEPVGSLWA